jgi:hypothetical protein
MNAVLATPNEIRIIYQVKSNILIRIIHPNHICNDILSIFRFSLKEIDTSIAGNDFHNMWPKDDVEDGFKAEEPKVCRASNRQRKVPSNRTDDFLWQI